MRRVCIHLRKKPEKGSDVFGHGRRGAVTACGLRTEDPVFALDRGELRRGERSGKWRGRVRNRLLWMSFYSAGSL